MNDDIVCARVFFPHAREKQNEENWKNDTNHYFSIDRTNAHKHDAPFLLAQNSLVSLFSPCARFFFRAIYIYI
jgi:hypothetical protein